MTKPVKEERIITVKCKSGEAEAAFRPDLIVGVISDTHGLLRPEALTALHGVSAIIHAGDIGNPDIIAALAAIAPVTAVRGNVDHGQWAEEYPQTAMLDTGAGRRLFVLHDIGSLKFDPAARGFAAVIYGHSHKPKAEWKDEVLYINPGSAGPRRFSLPISLARLRMSRGVMAPEFLDLAGASGQFAPPATGTATSLRRTKGKANGGS